MSVRRGLPETFRPRHDLHYVEALGEAPPETIGQMINISLIKPNAEQPRGNVGDLSGLKESIREKGILEPLVVKRNGGGYLIISGERRYRASLELGLQKVPCVIRESDERDTLEVALIENMQRKDLTPFEEADGLNQLSQKFELSHEEIARKIGKSRSSITETLSLCAIPDEIRTLCQNNGVTAKTMLLQIARQETAADMLALAQEIIKRGMNRSEARAVRQNPQTEKPRPFVFRHKAKDGSFRLSLNFRKSAVDKYELVAALKAAIEQIEQG